jgi:acetyltransferase EpsM
MKPLILIGGGGHARVVLDAARSQSQWQLVGYVDSAPNEAMSGLPYLGDDQVGLSRAADAWFVLGLGSIRVSDARAQLAARYGGVNWATIVDASAHLAPDVKLGAGTVVLPGALITSAARIGDHCVINTGAIVEHDCTVGDYAQVGPGAILGGGVTLGAHSFVGLGARVRNHLTIGEGAMVGMGAVVVGAVAAGATVVGVPARQKAQRDA